MAAYGEGGSPSATSGLAHFHTRQCSAIQTLHHRKVPVAVVVVVEMDSGATRENSRVGPHADADPAGGVREYVRRYRAGHDRAGSAQDLSAGDERGTAFVNSY